MIDIKAEYRLEIHDPEVQDEHEDKQKCIRRPQRARHLLSERFALLNGAALFKHLFLTERFREDKKR